MPILRTANIRNVNIFLDGKFLDNALEFSRGNEFRSHKTYGINPIYQNGVFHPKIMFLTGPKHGLLIIGSGNLTNSGLNTNDEIWGAFHIDNIDSVSSPIFSAVWNYLQSFIVKAKGFNNKKLQWISQYSPWLDKLPEYPKGDFVKMGDEEDIAFVANDSDSSIYKQILQLLPNSGLKKITIVSPYFDEKGEILQLLNSHFGNTAIDCLVDPIFGILPIGINEQILSKVKFWRWENCISDYNTLYNRLHAKLFHFEYDKRLEYLLIGSMNASLQAFGNDIKRASNEEAGIMIRRKSDVNYLKELGILIPNSDTLSIKNHPPNEKNKINPEPVTNKTIRILYSEIDNNKLQFYVENNVKVLCKLCIENHENDLLESFDIDLLKENNEVLVKSHDEVYKIYFNDLEGTRISNYSLIHRVFLQAKSNPNPIRESLDNIFAKGFDGVPELFAYVDFNWADEDDKIEFISSTAKTEKKEIQEHKKYDKLSQEEFNKVNQLIIQKQEGLLNSSSVQIAEFLGVLGRGLTVDKQEDVGESFEQQLLDDEEFALSGESKEVSSFKIIRTGGRTEQKAIHRFLNKLYDAFQIRLKTFFETASIIELPTVTITIKDLSNMLIGLYVLKLYSTKTYEINREIFSLQFNKKYSKELREIERKFKLERIEKFDQLDKFRIYYSIESDLLQSLKELIIKVAHFELELHRDLYNEPIKYNYFDDGEVGGDNSSIKGFLFNTLGSFLICCHSGVKVYEYEILNQKVEFFKKEIFKKTLNIIASVHWKETERSDIDLILLDLLNFVDSSIERAELVNLIDNSFLEGLKIENSESLEVESNIIYLKEKLGPKYIRWKTIYEDDRNQLIVNLSSLLKGNIIFKKCLGFCELITNDQFNLCLSKPGFPWDEKQKAYQLKNLIVGEKTIKFNC